MSLLSDIEAAIVAKCQAAVPSAIVKAVGTHGEILVEDVPAIEVVWAGPTTTIPGEDRPINGVTYQTLSVPIATLIQVRDTGDPSDATGRLAAYGIIDDLRSALLGCQLTVAGAKTIFPLLLEREEFGLIDVGLYGAVQEWRLKIVVAGERRTC